MTATLPAITEAAFQRQVVDLARIYGWDLVYHAQLAKWSEKGWPDLVLVRVRDRRLIFAELKRDGGRLTPRQEAVLGMLRAVECPYRGSHTAGGGSEPTVEVAVWRPADFAAIVETLR